jgi:hypothetical protein
LEPWNLASDRQETWEGAQNNAAVLWAWLMQGKGEKLLPTIGIVADPDAPPTVFRSRLDSRPAVEVHSVRTALRRGPRGGTPVTDLVVEITQRRRGYLDQGTQARMDAPGVKTFEKEDFMYRAGCTLLINPVTMEVRRVIRTAGTIVDNVQLERMRRFLADGGLSPSNAFNRAIDAIHSPEPFALLHRHEEA